MRRALPILAVAAAGLAVAPTAGARVKGFELGVAAGEVKAKSALIWAATKGSGKVVAEVATDRRFRNVVAEKQVRSKGSNDHTVQKKVKKLEPDERHYYRFCARRKCSDKGQFVTAPRRGASERVEFAYTGDADGTPAPGESSPFFGNFETYRQMRKEQNDFNINLGDTIYSDSGVGNVAPALTTEAKWGKYRQNLDVRNLRKLRGSASLYSHWDDHEFINDFSIPEDGQQLYRNGVRAFRDYAPVTYTEQNGLYRRFRWGSNLELFFLDERSFRSAKASANGVCDNPETGEPDLAPTAPQDKRDFFSTLIPSLDQPVSQQCKDTINSPNRTLLGQRQYARFLAAVDRSDARWKVIVNETPIQQFYGLPYDRWEGYAHERVALLNSLEQLGVKNLVFLTTDTHAAFANVVRTRTFADDVAPTNAPTSPHDTPFDDYIIGPVGTNTFWAEIDDVTGQPNSGRLLSRLFFKPDPPDGVGMFCAQGDVYSYGQVRVTRSRLTISYKDLNGDTVLDWDGQEPCGPYVLTAE